MMGWKTMAGIKMSKNNKSDSNIIQDNNVKVKSKKTKKVDDVKIDDVKIDDVKIDDVKVDVEIDLRSSNSMQPGVYIRRKRSIWYDGI